MNCGNCSAELAKALQERDKLIAALKLLDEECRFCAHVHFMPEECADYCDQCIRPCACYTCRDRDNYKFVGIDECAEC